MKDTFLLCHAISFLYCCSLFKPVKLKTLLAEYNDMWAFCATYFNSEFYHSRVCVCVRVCACMHISGLAPPPTQSFCLQARLLITDSSCFQRWQFRATNQSRGEQPCYLSQAGSLTPLLSPWTLPALLWQKENKKPALWAELQYRCPDPVQRWIFRKWA